MDPNPSYDDVLKRLAKVEADCKFLITLTDKINDNVTNILDIIKKQQQALTELKAQGEDLNYKSD